MHHSLIVRGATCWRCLGPTVALFTSVECAAACHERWDLYSPKQDPRVLAYQQALRAITSFAWPTPPPPSVAAHAKAVAPTPVGGFGGNWGPGPVQNVRP